MRRRQAYAIKFPMTQKSDIVRLDTPQKSMPESEKKTLVIKKRGRPRKQEV